MRFNRKGQGMLEYILVVAAVMAMVVAFAWKRMGPATTTMLNKATAAVDAKAASIPNIVNVP